MYNATMQIHNDDEHAAALKRIEELFFAEPGTAEGDELDHLATLVEQYEDIHFPIPSCECEKTSLDSKRAS